jgi:predicted transposase/invertase (TIGR01784 family)
MPMPKTTKKRQPSGQNDHDKLFKGTFSIREIALLHLQDQISPALQSHFDWDSLQLSNDSFVEGQLRTYFADIVYTMKLKSGTPFRVCLLYEHKSKLPDRAIYIQLLQYMLGIWRKNLEQNQPLDFVLPIIVYHGKAAWKTKPFSAEFEGLPVEFLPYLPVFAYHLTDIRSMPGSLRACLKFY